MIPSIKILQQKLNTIKLTFDVSRVISLKCDIASIAKYYRINKFPYAIFHSRDDFVHMGISRTGRYKKEDLLESIKYVEKYISPKTEKVLELATGKGAVNAYIAKRFPAVKFYGIDLPNGQLDIALKNAKSLKNFYPSEGDYHQLTYFRENMFDIVFVIEALCHSTNKKRVLQEVKRVLKKNGVFIIIDGYAKKPLSSFTESEKIAKKLIEKGMMVESMEYYKKFKKQALSIGFKKLFEEDVSLLILPTVERFEQLTKRFFSLPYVLKKTMIKILPSEFTYNAISGYLLPELIKLGLADYEILILQK